MTNRPNLAKFKTNMTVKEKRQTKQKAKRGRQGSLSAEAKTIRSVKIATLTVVTLTKDVHMLTTAIGRTTTLTAVGMRIADIRALTIISMKVRRATIRITGVIPEEIAATTDAEVVTTIEEADLPMTATPTRRQPQPNKPETQKLLRVSQQETDHKEKDRREESRDLITQIEVNIGVGTVDQEVAVVIAVIMKEGRAEMARRPSIETRGEMNVAMGTDPSL